MTSHERDVMISRRRLIGIGAGIGFAAIVTGCGILANNPETTATTPPSSPEYEANKEIDLLQAGTFDFMPGAKKEGHGLTVEHTGMALRTLEDTWQNSGEPEYIAVPPQNIYGTHIRMSEADGSVGFTAQLSDLKGQAVLSFQTKPTYHYDERTYCHSGIDISIEGSVLTITPWEEGQAKSSPAAILPLHLSSTPGFTLTQTSRGTAISSGDQKFQLPGKKMFTEGEIWFGMNASENWKLDSFKAYPLEKTQIQPINVNKIDFGTLSPSGLQAAVSKKRPDLVIGTAVDLASMLSDPHLAKLVVENFDGLATEMLAKPQVIQPEEGRFVWNEFDGLADFAKRHHKKIHLHTLIFSEANPKWLEDKLASASPEQALTLMRQHIQPIASRHQNDVHTIDVINEPFDPDNWAELRQNLWTKPLGASYIDAALRITHEAAPDALLGINEWGLETDDDRWSALINLVKGMKTRGVPIHYVGFQAHFDEETIADSEVMDAILHKNQLEKRFKELDELGIKVRVSEMSVAGNNKTLQAQIYAAVLNACKNAPNCIGFNVWGAASNAAYFTSEPSTAGLITPIEFGDDAPWQQNKDGTYSQKPAVAAMKKVMQ